MHARTFKRCGTFGLGIAVGCLALAAFARVAYAESVYKCRAPDGAIAFQDHPCADARAESVVELAPFDDTATRLGVFASSASVTCRCLPITWRDAPIW